MNAVFIPTRMRTKLLLRCIKNWERDDRFSLFAVTDKQFFSPVHEMLWETSAKVMTLKKNDRGIGYARNQILHMAEAMGLKSFLMCDDDAYPMAAPEDNMESMYEMLRFARRRDVVGIGAWQAIYGMMLGNTALSTAADRAAGRKAEHAAFLTRGSVGTQLVAINTKNALGIGGYDPHLGVGEDQELIRRGIANGFPWYIYASANANTENRFTEGGISSLPKSVEEIATKSHRITKAKWPEYTRISEDGTRVFVRWKKMYDNFIPGLEWPLENTRAGGRPFEWRTATRQRAGIGEI